MQNSQVDMINQHFNSEATLSAPCGKGKGSPVPDVVAKRFNWGVFWNITWFWWCLSNSTWTPLIRFLFGPIFFVLCFIGCFSIGIVAPGKISTIMMLCLILYLASYLAFCIYCGINGNKWAWQNRHWNSINEFHRIQKLWAIWGTALIVISWLINILMFVSFVATAPKLSPAELKQQDERQQKATQTRETLDLAIKNGPNTLPKKTDEAIKQYLTGKDLYPVPSRPNLLRDIYGTEYFIKINNDSKNSDPNTISFYVGADLNGVDTPPNKVGEDRIIYTCYLSISPNGNMKSHSLSGSNTKSYSYNGDWKFVRNKQK